MAGRPRRRAIQEARETAIAEGNDPDEAEDKVRAELGLEPRRKKVAGSEWVNHDVNGPAPKDIKKLAEVDYEREADKPPTEEELEEADAYSGKNGKRMTALDQVKRDAALVQLMKRGISPAQAGAQFGLHVRTVQKIRRQYREQEPDLSQLDPSELIRDTLDNYEAVIEELALVAARTDHGPTKVGAVRVRLEALRGRIELLQSVGVMPHDLGQIRVIEDAQLVSRQIVDVFERFDIPEEAVYAVLDVIEGRAPPLPAGPALEAAEAEEIEDAEEVEDDGGAVQED